MSVFESWWASGPFTIRLNKYGSIWSYRAQNGVGGSVGSSHRGTKKTVLYIALRGMPEGTRYTLVTNGRDEGERIHALQEE